MFTPTPSFENGRIEGATGSTACARNAGAIQRTSITGRIEQAEKIKSFKEWGKDIVETMEVFSS
jgi:hypothetical protein